MKLRSYMNDYHDTYVCGKDNIRAMYRAGFSLGGLSLAAIGAFIGSINMIAGLPMVIIGGLIGTSALLYFRPIK